MSQYTERSTVDYASFVPGSRLSIASLALPYGPNSQSNGVKPREHRLFEEGESSAIN
jgi:hypothetical protein